MFLLQGSGESVKTSAAHSMCILGFAFFFLGMISPPVSASDISHQVGIHALTITGETVYETTYQEGVSRLEWPIDVTTGALTYGISWKDSIEAGLQISACPWRTISQCMEDYDWIDESSYSGRPVHDELDIYSKSSLDSKVMLFGAHARYFFLSNTFCAFGLNVGYQFQEYDYRAYDTLQEGYGPWQDQTSSVSGPVATYTVKYELWNLGVSLRAHLDDVITVTLDTAVVPDVKARDEDTHLRRSRVTASSCSGYGNQTSLSTVFHCPRGWDVNTVCSLACLRTRGWHSQYWYGDDPASGRFDDTGQSLTGIRAEIDQHTFSVSIGASYRF
ncbi:MAG: omptin family outer membrane protease [Desulfomonilia bacterium]